MWDRYPAIANWWLRVRTRPSVKAAIFDRMSEADWAPFKNLTPDPQPNGPLAVNGNLQSQFRVESDMELRDQMTFRIAAHIVDIQPNGNLVLEAHRTVRNNEELWMHSLTGICRREDIGPGNLLLSKDILHLNVEKRETGHMRDSYKRGWSWRWTRRTTWFARR